LFRLHHPIKNICPTFCELVLHSNLSRRSVSIQSLISNSMLTATVKPIPSRNTNKVHYKKIDL
ncbi:hypothetical protein LINPERHAP1_LOCUS14827, partial [Linum perenne]